MYCLTLKLIFLKASDSRSPYPTVGVNKRLSGIASSGNVLISAVHRTSADTDCSEIELGLSVKLLASSGDLKASIEIELNHVQSLIAKYCDLPIHCCVDGYRDIFLPV